MFRVNVSIWLMFLIGHHAFCEMSEATHDALRETIQSFMDASIERNVDAIIELMNPAYFEHVSETTFRDEFLHEDFSVSKISLEMDHFFENSGYLICTLKYTVRNRHGKKTNYHIPTVIFFTRFGSTWKIDNFPFRSDVGLPEFSPFPDCFQNGIYGNALQQNPTANK